MKRLPLFCVVTVTAAGLGTVASAESAGADRRARQVCMQYLLTQAQNGDYDIVADEITMTVGLGESSNSTTVSFEVDAPTVSATGQCLVIGNKANAYVKDVSVQFVNK